MEATQSEDQMQNREVHTYLSLPTLTQLTLKGIQGVQD